MTIAGRSDEPGGATCARDRGMEQPASRGSTTGRPTLALRAVRPDTAEHGLRTTPVRSRGPSRSATARSGTRRSAAHPKGESMTITTAARLPLVDEGAGQHPAGGAGGGAAR